MSVPGADAVHADSQQTYGTTNGRAVTARTTTPSACYLHRLAQDTDDTPAKSSPRRVAISKRTVV